MPLFENSDFKEKGANGFKKLGLIYRIDYNQPYIDYRKMDSHEMARDSVNFLCADVSKIESVCVDLELGFYKGNVRELSVVLWGNAASSLVWAARSYIHEVKEVPYAIDRTSCLSAIDELLRVEKLRSADIRERLIHYFTDSKITAGEVIYPRKHIVLFNPLRKEH